MLTTSATDTSPTAGRQTLALSSMLAAVAVVALLGSLATIPHTEGGWYATADRVPWSPPNWLFGPAWSVLYALMAVSGFLIWRRGFRGGGQRNAATPVLWLFVIQLLLNGLWTPMFFAMFPLIGAAGWWIALADIVLLIIVVVIYIVRSARVSRVAAGLFVPYGLWLLFASTLNIGIIVLN